MAAAAPLPLQLLERPRERPVKDSMVTSSLSSREPKPLTEREVKSALEYHLQEAIGGLERTEIIRQQATALKYYKGSLFGNEQEGRSKVVLTDVSDTVEWIMPDLMRMFTGGRVVAKFTASSPQHDQFAEDATEYVHDVFMNDCGGWKVMHDWFKDALIQKVGAVKASLDVRTQPRFDVYDLDELQLALLLDDETVEIVAHQVIPKIVPNRLTGQASVEEVYRVKVRHRRETRRIKVEGVAPEDFLISRRAIQLDDETPFAAQRMLRSVSDLVAMGFPYAQVVDLAPDDLPEYTIGKTERFSDDHTIPFSHFERTDPASRQMWVTECHLPIDADGDGFAELRKYLIAGESSITLLDDEEEEFNPFATICPVPIPHKFHGLSLADLVMELQLIRSTVLRQILDNMYLTNNSRLKVVESMVEVQDLLTSRPGGIIRVKAQGAVEPLETTQLGPLAFNVLETLKEERENRTGITRYNQGMDASSLNQTAHGMERIMRAAEARKDLIARIFAETGVKRLFSNLLKLVVGGPTEQRKIDGTWKTFNPAQWDPDMKVEVEVLQGVGTQQQTISELGILIKSQYELARTPFGSLIVGPQEVYESHRRLATAMGYRSTSAFFQNPRGKQMPPPPPDPAMEKIKADMMIEQGRRAETGKQHQVEAVEWLSEFLESQRTKDIEFAVRREQIESQEDIALAQIAVQRDQGGGDG